jgi:hypothetical protein
MQDIDHWGVLLWKCSITEDRSETQIIVSDHVELLNEWFHNSIV